MSEITEKRTFKIPPCKIDKDLINEIGQILREDAPRGQKPHFTLEASTKDIESDNVDQFTCTPFPSDTTEISMSVGGWGSPKINVNIYLRRSIFDSAVGVTGQNATWVHGVAERLYAAFKKKKLGYHLIAERSSLRLMMSIMTSILITYTLYLVLSPILMSIALEEETIASIIGILFLFPIIAWYEILTWLFPYFEFGDAPLQKRIRKWVLAILWGSGLIPAIVFKLFGFG